MEHKGTVYIETKRLILRRFTVSDAEAMYENWASDEEVIKYLTWQTHGDISVSEGVLREWVNNYARNDFYQWAIVFKEYSDKPIGSIAVVENIDETVGKAHI